MELLHVQGIAIQWNLSSMDTLRTKTIVLISEVSLFQENTKLGLSQVSLLTKVSLFHRCPLREFALYTKRKCTHSHLPHMHCIAQHRIVQLHHGS